MRHGIARLSVAIVAIAASPIIPSATASAPVGASDAKQAMVCVSKAEFRKIEKGQSFAKVRRIVGGKPVATYPDSKIVERQWKECGMQGLSASVIFTKPGDKVKRKIWDPGCGGRATAGERC